MCIGFGNDNNLGQARDNFVAFHCSAHEPGRMWMKLAEQEYFSRYNLRQEAIHLNVAEFVDTMRQHYSCISLCARSPFVGGTINSASETADDISILFSQTLSSLACKHYTCFTCITRADNCDIDVVENVQVASVKENRRKFVRLQGCLDLPGIALIEYCQYVNAIVRQLFDKGCLFSQQW